MQIKTKQSPSSINLFINDPALWVLKTFYGWTGSSNIYSIRGKLAEDYVNFYFEHKKEPNFDEYFEYAVPKFLYDGVNITESDLVSFYNWGKKCFDLIIQHGEPLSSQKYVAGEIEGVKVGGYIDFEYNKWFLDLKTVSKIPELLKNGRLPSTKKDNMRQQVCYFLLIGKAPCLLFVNEKGENLGYRLNQEEVQKFTLEIQETLKKIKILLDMKKEDVIMEVFPNFNKMQGITWDDQARHLAKKLWNV